VWFKNCEKIMAKKLSTRRVEPHAQKKKKSSLIPSLDACQIFLFYYGLKGTIKTILKVFLPLFTSKYPGYSQNKKGQKLMDLTCGMA